ncbi:hypothetical protein PACTADRAFT_52073 [Pachysolen tannophilus NRRL Y-2460]|uniref:Anaphase-promoting complex subunit 4 WD40 domain-containing protein n=1 Tax=Pachysolen tannophilus NRRL Y-2460 TaxID=669874 RepID=A0A1E4TP29_PACTA|nr:hypothetical protein PACTADRAFT_52073 [Pachysolen tannophilus NRRL Y-2460]
MMKEPIKPFATGHEELIHNVAYDFYGKQLATCSSDQHIKVFDLDPLTSTWVLNDSWKAHDSSVVKVVFASPEFGHILASISFDRTIKIWEEDFDEQNGSGRRWKKMATISDSYGPLYDISFAPSHLGLRIGTIGNDGILRVYDAIEPSDIRHWTLTNEINVLSSPPAPQLQSDFSLSWCPSRFSSEKLVVCALDQGFIYQKNKNDKFVLATQLPEHNGLIRSVSWAPSMGRYYQLIATGCKDGLVRIFKLTETIGNKSVPNDDQMDTSRDEDIEGTGSALNARNDHNNNNNNIGSGADNSLNHIHVELLSSHDDHKGEVWKVKWNLTGSILSSAGDDAKIRLWKATYSNKFQCMSVISAQQK